ncbi:MAG: H-NS histone family protein [Pseudomonadota bacterium]
MAKKPAAKKKPSPKQVDLSKLTLAELQTLRSDVDAALAAQEQSARANALKEVEAAAKAHGFALTDLTGGTKPKPRAKRKAPAPAAPKYQHPENASLTWSGRGRQPRWFKEAVDGGASPDQFLIK